jgi:hypothetical protein
MAAAASNYTPAPNWTPVTKIYERMLAEVRDRHVVDQRLRTRLADPKTRWRYQDRAGAWHCNGKGLPSDFWTAPWTMRYWPRGQVIWQETRKRFAGRKQDWMTREWLPQTETKRVGEAIQIWCIEIDDQPEDVAEPAGAIGAPTGSAAADSATFQQSLPPTAPTAGAGGRPPLDADKVTQLEWAYGQLFESGELTGLRGKARLKAVCAKVGPKFTASQTSLKDAMRKYRK